MQSDSNPFAGSGDVDPFPISSSERSPCVIDWMGYEFREGELPPNPLPSSSENASSSLGSSLEPPNPPLQYLIFKYFFFSKKVF